MVFWGVDSCVWVDQVGGYYERHQGLTLATVRDAGHMVRLCCLYKHDVLNVLDV